MVQVRWGHINRDYSLLTQVQSVLLDGHFILEHGGRNRSGRFFNFNGTAGVWRRAAIGDAGGWQHDTLTEDLDLSLPRADARLAVRVRAGRGLAGRDAGGDERLQEPAAPLGQGLRSRPARSCCPASWPPSLPLPIKVEAAFHLTANFAYPLMIAAVAAHVPGHGHPLQHGLVRDDDRGRAALPGRHHERLLVLPDEPARGLRRRLEAPASSTCPRCWRWASASR